MSRTVSIRLNSRFWFFGSTLTRPVKFEDCITAIKDHAFAASLYPVIITIENHLRPEMQIQAAKVKILRTFGERDSFTTS